MTDLLPCPFCGGEAKREDIEAREGVENAGASYITCARCWASTALHFDRKENLESSWNDRSPQFGYSCDGINLHGDKPSIDAANEAFHSHGQIEDLRRNLRHWREECGKLHAKIGKENALLSVAAWMIAHSYVTGHGDTMEDLLSELEAQVEAKLRQALEEQMAVSLRLMDRLGFDQTTKLDCTAQARNALKLTNATP